MNDIRAIHPSWWDRFHFILLAPRSLLLVLICLSYRNFIWGMGLLPPRYMAWTARIRARRAFFSRRTQGARLYPTRCVLHTL